MGQPSRVIFIGNISFDLSEQQIIDIFKDVGPIINFKLMFDRETGKPRGFAFCEYADVETANSAIRNLNGYEINSRTLKVDYADQDTPLTGGGVPTQHSQGHSSGSTSQQHSQPSTSGSTAGVGASGNGTFIPLNTMMNQNYTSVEAVNATLASLSNQQLHELLMHAKNLSLNDPVQAKAFLEANPALSYALLQAMLLMNAVDARVAQQILGSSFNKQQASAAPSQPSQQPQAQQSQRLAQSGPEDDQQKLIETIMALSEDQIAALPKEQQDQIRAIKAQFAR